MSPAAQRATFEARFGALYELQGSGADPYRVRSTEIDVDGWVFSRSEIFNEFQVARDADRIRRHGFDGVSLVYHMHGDNRIEADGVAQAWPPKSLLIIDMARPNRYALGRGAQVRLRLPRSAAEGVFGGGFQVHNVVRSDISARMLGDYLLSFVDHVRLQPAEDLSAVMANVQSLLSATLSPSRDNLARAAEPINAGLYARACRQIDRDLLSGSLTPESLAAAIGVSRRKLYQLFEASGGVAKAIQARRLDHAHAVLAKAVAVHRIKDVAYAHGFASDAHFARCFKQRFGYRPSEAAEAAAGPSGAPEHGGVRPQRAGFVFD